MIKVDINDLTKFSVKIDSKTKDNTKVMEAVKKSTLSVQKTARNNLASNGSVKTGHLRRSIAYKFGHMEGTVHTSNVKYAEGVEKGTRPHIIKPKSKKALYWKGASHPVKFVKHPGSKAKPYLIPALESEKEKFIKNLKEVIKFD